MGVAEKGGLQVFAHGLLPMKDVLNMFDSGSAHAVCSIPLVDLGGSGKCFYELSPFGILQGTAKGSSLARQTITFSIERSNPAAAHGGPAPEDDTMSFQEGFPFSPTIKHPAMRSSPRTQPRPMTATKPSPIATKPLSSRPSTARHRASDNASAGLRSSPYLSRPRSARNRIPKGREDRAYPVAVRHHAAIEREKAQKQLKLVSSHHFYACF